MDDRFNTAAGWVLFAGVIALGLSIISGKVFHTERPETLGYPIEVADAGGAEETGPDLGTLLAAADVAAGATAAAARCGTCHSFESGGANGQGPNLWNTMGAPLAGHAGFGYSSALTEKGGTWTWDAMNDWLLNPKRFAPGTSMGFAGLKNNEDRANILVYLNSLGSNLPLPEPKAAEEPAAEEAAADAEAEGAAEEVTEQDAAAEVEEVTE
ncbi:c-type cytochrome [Pontixanthobacter aestiaquae]|uniref:C-type cytochrome n=1 Tax=Pontixanthobacter aestiaquae TaxID=1509367 RepID=A0A844Z9H4_9SPHN|nr:c-type cytochrome [Pontixanthobacter aestiaquae]MDN3646473.1 c-type cytochrome [Pontixanthobacter aestiaquae]MXO82539.1 c-type cytochrome [Pontixanthobacter aestiaquae]